MDKTDKTDKMDKTDKNGALDAAWKSSSGKSASGKHRIVIRKVTASQAVSPRQATRWYKDKDPVLWAALMVQRNLRRRLFVSAVERLLVFNERRRKILREMLESEKVYRACLFNLMKDFVAPMGVVLSKPEMDTVFPHVPEIFKLHESLLRDFTALMSAHQSKYHDLCQLFEGFSAKATVEYRAFANLVDRGSLVLRVLLNNNVALQDIVAKAEAPSKYIRGLPYLQELLGLPLKQLPRYELMFAMLLRCSTQHDDLPALTAAHTAISNLVLTISEEKELEEEKFHRSYLEAYGRVDVLGNHKLALQSISSVKHCAHCSKSIWGLVQKCYYCSKCENYYHPQCQTVVQAQKSCASKARLDLNKKRIVFSEEVRLMPDDAARIMAEREAKNKGRSAGEKTSPRAERKESDLHKVFGVALDDVIARDGRAPPFLFSLYAYLRANGTTEEGIFRVAGRESSMVAWKAKIDNNPALKFDPEELKVHDAAGLIKAYFCELPVPLFPYSMFADLKAIDLAGEDADIDAQMLYCLSQLSRPAYTVLTELVRLCVAIAAQSATNKMGPSNLAVAIANGVIRPPMDDKDVKSFAATARQINALFQRLIERADVYFDEKCRPKVASNFNMSFTNSTIGVQLRGLLMAFADGLGIGYQWRYEHSMDPQIDVMGELPWKLCSFARTGEENGMHKFQIISGSFSWTFHLLSEADVVALEHKFLRVQQAAMTKTKLGESSEASIRMTLMMKEDRYSLNEKLSSSFVLQTSTKLLWELAKTSDGRGDGLFATRAIPATTLVMLQPGDLLVKAGEEESAHLAQLVVGRKDDDAACAQWLASSMVRDLHKGNVALAISQCSFSFLRVEREGACFLREASYFNHSCLPNVCVLQRGSRFAFYALRDIACGEELLISYVDELEPTAERQQKLSQVYGFTCVCSRCVTGEGDAVAHRQVGLASRLARQPVPAVGSTAAATKK